MVGLCISGGRAKIDFAAGIMGRMNEVLLNDLNTAEFFNGLLDRGPQHRRGGLWEILWMKGRIRWA